MINPNDDSVGSADVHQDPLACHIEGFAIPPLGGLCRPGNGAT